MKENNIKILSQVEHVLQRTGMYVGSTKPIDQSMFVLDGESMVYRKVNYVPALLKIVREVIDNAIDEHVRTSGRHADAIRIEVDPKGWISVQDNGRGIPVKKVKKGDHEMWGPEAAWTELRAGANFDDEKDNITLGQNGVGASLTCILSKMFIGETCDGTSKFRIVCKDNLSDKKVSVTPDTAHRTVVTFMPDYARFGLTGLDETHMSVLRTDVANLAMAYPSIAFYFNKKRVNGKSFDAYAKQFGKEYEIYDTGDLLVALVSNDETDDFNFVHYVNGINAYEGGNPFNFVADTVLNGMLDRLSKKFKTMKKGDIKNKVTIVAFIRNLPNPRFDSQAKSKCINPPSEVKDLVKESIMDAFLRRIAKNDKIVLPIIEIFQAKEELRGMKDLAGMAKGKKVRCDKYLAPIGPRKYLALCEGASAKGGLSAVLGRTNLGYYELKGVPLNTYEVTAKRMSENEEFSNIVNILGLRLHDEKARECSFQNILFATDADLDGGKISSLLCGFFAKYAKWMFTDGRIKRLKTPVIILKNGEKIVKFFFTFDEYNEYIKNHDVTKFRLKYLKGLGSFKSDELSQLVSIHGLEYFIETFVLDEGSEKAIDDWLGKDNVEVRKEMLRKNKFNIFMI